MKFVARTLALTIALGAAQLPTFSVAQDSSSIVVADMHGKGMQGGGMQGQGMQGPGAKSPPGSGSGPGMNMNAPGGAMTPGMSGPGMMMGSQDRPMMQMMVGGMAVMAPDRIEGRIAFLHAELKITEAQMPAWTDFANVLRANAKRLADARAASPQRTSGSTAVERIDDQERWLTVRLDMVRALKPAFGKLRAVLDDKQTKTADELVGVFAVGYQ